MLQVKFGSPPIFQVSVPIPEKLPFTARCALSVNFAATIFFHCIFKMFRHTFSHMTYIKSDTNTADKKLVQRIKKILFHPKH